MISSSAVLAKGPATTAGLTNDPPEMVARLVAAVFFGALVAPLGKIVVGGSTVAAIIDILTIVAVTLVAITRFQPRVKAADAALFGLAALATLELLNPNILDPVAAIAGLRLYVIGLPWYVLGRSIQLTDPALRRAFLMLLPAALIELADGVRQALVPLPFDAALRAAASSSDIVFEVARVGTQRVFGSLPGPFHLGVLAALVLVMALGALCGWKRALVVTLATTTVLLTYTRGNWVAAAAGIFAWVLTFAIRRASRPRTRAAAAAILVTVLAIIAALVTGLLTLPMDVATNLVSGQVDLQYRFDSWQGDVGPAIAAAPLGYGTGSALDALLTSGVARTAFSSHNFVFKCLLEVGWLGGVCLAVFFACIGLAAARFARRGGAMGVSAFAAVVTVVTAGLSLPVLDTYPATVPFWLIAGSLGARQDHR